MIYNPESGYFGIRYNGKWNDVLFAGLEAFWLYNKGNEFTSRTGGWNSPDGVATKYSDHITLVSPAVTNTASSMQTVNLVDLTNFDKLSIDFNCISPNVYATYEIDLLDESGNIIKLRYTYGGGGFNRGTLILDIAKYKAKYRIRIRAVTGSNFASTVNVYSVLLL